MTIRNCLGWTIRVRWFDVVLVAFAALGAQAQSLETAVRGYREKPSAVTRAAVIRAAKPQSLGRFALASADLEGRRMAEALEGFDQARKELPHLADHAEYGAVQALISLGRKGEALPILKSLIVRDKPVSPWRAAGVFALSQILMEQNQAEEAAALLLANRADVPQAKGRYLYALAVEAAGNAKAAALEYQTVFFEYARSAEAEKAREALDRLRTALGKDYPPEMPSAWIGRADQLIEGGRGKEAIAELARLIPTATGADKDRAEVRIGTARYRVRDYAGALQHLSSLKVSQAVLDAERLYHVAASARRLNRAAQNTAALQDLAAKHPVSPWRLEALLGEVAQYLVANQPERYEPIYEVCFTTFARDEKAGDCHWKYAWSHYLRRAPDAGALLWNQVKRFPASEDAPAAMYFLGRLAEQKRAFGEARALYEAVSSRYPNYYYGVISRERLGAAVLARIKPAADTARQLAEAGLSESGAGADFAMDDSTRLRILRSGQLAAAGIDDWAELELRFGANVDAKRNLIGIELAQMAVRQGRQAQGLRYAKSYSGKYLTWHMKDAPDKFWKLAFPLYYRDSLEKYSQSNELDPYIVAGLIRQESEFDPEVVSRARAIGLTQIMPATGRDLSKRLGIRRFRTSMLTEPEFNLRLGTYYLKSILDSQDGLWVRTLAGYNAGPSRANRWKTWGTFREPSEFIETIPFSETRNYVQSVLRNADVYRRLYGTSSARVRSTIGASNSSPNQRGRSAAGRR